MRRGFAPQQRRRPQHQFQGQGQQQQRVTPQQRLPRQDAHIRQQFINRAAPIVDPSTANLTHRVPGNVQLEKEIADLKKQLTQIADKQHVMTAEVLVDKLPFFLEAPFNLTGLSGKTGTLTLGQRITVMYPQTDRNGMVFMTLQHVDSQTGESQHYQVPLVFDGLSNIQIEQAMNVDVSDIQDSYSRVQFLGNFKSIGL